MAGEKHRNKKATKATQRAGVGGFGRDSSTREIACNTRETAAQSAGGKYFVGWERSR